MDPEGQTLVERWLLVFAVLGVLGSVPASHERLKVHLHFGVILDGACLSELAHPALPCFAGLHPGGA